MLIEVAAALACATATDPAAAAVRAARASFNRAIEREDLEAIASTLAEDVILVTGTDSDVINGRKAQLDTWRNDFHDDARLIYVRTPDCVSPSPLLPIVLETGSWRGSRQAGGDDFVGGTYAAKWRLIDNRWVLEAETFVTTTCNGGLCPAPQDAAP